VQWERTIAGYIVEVIEPIAMLVGVSRTQYVYAIAVPLLAFLIVRTLSAKEKVGGKAARRLTELRQG
jgi:hypothetical protein